MAKKFESKDVADFKASEGKESFEDEGKWDSEKLPPPSVNILGIEILPAAVGDIAAPLELKITFDLDRDCVASFWQVKFLVDSCNSRIIRVLGETPVEDYPDGDSDMLFKINRIDVSDIPPSTLANSGLLMAEFVVDGEVVTSVNMVVNVYSEGGALMREILSPMD